MRALALAVLGLALAIPAPANGPSGSAALLAADRAHAAATAARGLDGYLASFAPDAALSRFGAPDLGGPAIRAYLEPLFAVPGLTFTWEPEGADAAASGDLGWTWGRYRLAAPAAGGEPRRQEGYYVRVWRRAPPDGPWRVAADVINTRSELPAGPRPAPPSAALPVSGSASGERAALMLADRDFEQETAARGTDGWVAWFAPDGLQIGTGDKLLRGHDAIRVQMAPLFGNPAQRLTWRPLAAEAAASGDLGYTIGAWEFLEKDAAGAAKVTGRGRYLTVWRKQADGSWKVVADLGNPFL